MSPNTKTVLRWLAFVAILVIVWFLGGHYAQAQTEYYKVNLTYTASTERAAPIFYIPKADVDYLVKRFGTDELQREFQQVVNKLKSRISNERDNDLSRAKRFLTEQEKTRILQEEETYRDTVGTFERGQTQGSLIIETPEKFAANIGKSLSPRLEFLGASEVAPRPFQTGGPTFEGLFTDLFIPYGLIVTLLGVLLIVAIAS